MIKTQIWNPDTCSCIIEQQYDSSLPIDLVVFSVKSVIKKCEFHADLTTPKQVFDTLMEENPRKNKSISAILDNAPTEWVETDTKTGDKRLKDGIVIDYDFISEQGKSKRTLELSVIGVDSNSLSKTKKEQLQSKLDTIFSNKEKDDDVVFKDAKLTRGDDIEIINPINKP